MPQLARSGVNNNGSGVRRKSRVSDAGDISATMHYLRADADGTHLVSKPIVADINIIVAGAMIDAGVTTQCNVVAAADIVLERREPDSRVVAREPGAAEERS